MDLTPPKLVWMCAEGRKGVVSSECVGIGSAAFSRNSVLV